MATRSLTGLVAEWFTPSDQKGSDEPTRYKLKPLNGLQFMEIAGHGEALADGTFMPDHEGRKLILIYGMKGWDNLSDPSKDDKPLSFNLARLKFVPAPHLVECVNELLERSALGAEDSKNSESQ